MAFVAGERLETWAESSRRACQIGIYSLNYLMIESYYEDGNMEKVTENYRRSMELWWILRQVNNVTLKAMENELRESGKVSYMHGTILYLVKAIETTTGKQATPSEISRWLIREPHTISTLLIRMEKQGLLRKTKDLERKNIVRITLTDKGEEALRQAMKTDTIVNIMSYLSDKEQDSLRAHLETLRRGALEEFTGSLRGKTPDTYAVSPKII